MRGRILVIGLVAILTAFGVALWYFQNHAYYEELPQQPFFVQSTEYPVETWQGIDANTSPLKMRVCLTVTAQTAEQIALDQVRQKPLEPLVAPYWFDCFDARQISRDLKSGAATLFMMGPARMEGADLFLALYPDGRGFAWSHLREEYRQ
ncbi:MAG: DUF6446 family protein [Pseudomonadota bacterium]